MAGDHREIDVATVWWASQSSSLFLLLEFRDYPFVPAMTAIALEQPPVKVNKFNYIRMTNYIS